MYRAETISWNFSMTHGILLGRDNSEFRVVNFCPIPENNTLEFYFYI